MTQKRNTRCYFALLSTILFLLGSVASTAFAAPDIQAVNLTGSGSFTTGSTITFYGNAYNAGTEMNVGNSYRPVRISGQSINNSPGTDIFVSAPYEYVAAGDNGAAFTGDEINIFNNSNPASPSKVWGKRIDSDANIMSSSDSHVVVYGSRMYTAEGEWVRAYDISNPSSPTYLGGIWLASGDIRSNSPSTRIYSLTAYGDYLYALWVTPGGFVTVIDFSTPSNPAKGTTINTGKSVTGATANFHGLQLDGSTLYLAIANVLQRYSLANPAVPAKTGEASLTVAVDGGPTRGCMAGDVAISGNYAYIASEQCSYIDPVTMAAVSTPDRLNVVRLSDMTRVNTVLTRTNQTNVLSAQVLGNNLYLGTSYRFTGVGSSIEVFDISNPEVPVRKGLGTGSTAYSRDLSLPSSYYIHTLEAGPYEVYEPHTYTRFCLTNSGYSATDLNNCLYSATNRLSGTSDADAGRLGGGALASAVTANYSNATLGTHTLYFCADVPNLSIPSSIVTFPDGVGESNESNNCSYSTFTILPPTVTITASASSGGMISPSGAVTVNYGSNPTFTMTPNANYYIFALTVDGSPIAPASSYTFTNVITNRTITATFALISGNLTLPGSCVIAAGAGACPATASWNTAGASDPNLFDVNMSSRLYNQPNSSGSTVWVAYPYTDFQLRNGSTVLSSGRVNSSCAVGTTWNGNSCQLYGCQYGTDSALQTIPLLSVDRAPIPSGSRHRVYMPGHASEFDSSGYFCFRNSGGPTYLAPLRTWTEFKSFWDAIPRLSGMSKMP